MHKWYWQIATPLQSSIVGCSKDIKTRFRGQSLIRSQADWFSPYFKRRYWRCVFAPRQLHARRVLEISLDLSCLRVSWLGAAQAKSWPLAEIQIIGIKQEIIRIIVLGQLISWICWHGLACLPLSSPSHPDSEAVLRLAGRRCWRLISHLWARRTTIGVCQLLKIGMWNPDIIRINSKNI